MLPDILFGTLATLLGAIGTYCLRKNKWLAALPPVVLNGVIVGAVVHYCYTPEMALPLYVAISTDTGCFVYSNTTPETHRIAANLMETGFDAQWVNKRHFRVKSLKRMQIESRLVRDMDLEQNGSLVFAYVTLDMIRELQATEEDLEDISSFIGLLEGVDNAVTVRQLKPEECKISLRTDGKSLNASLVCARFGGGGHPAAAGCTIHGTPAQAKAAMLDAIEQVQHG